MYINKNGLFKTLKVKYIEIISFKGNKKLIFYNSNYKF